MMFSRRRWLALAATAPLLSCASAPPPPDRIVDTATGQPLTPQDVRRRMREADVVLLGELHDNTHHHARRAMLLEGFGSPLTVVAEHLPRGAAPVLPQGASSTALREALEASGFDMKGWRWPMHEALFMAIARAGDRLIGGNLERDTARRLAREGLGAMPEDLAAWVNAAPLSTAARAALEQDLLDGHCGQLSAARMPGMVAAQRGRDAAMAQALVAQRGAGRPVVLIAGNGHVRRDYGVPTLLAARPEPPRVLSIGFVEQTATTDARAQPYDISWATAAVPREDACEGMSAPASAPRAAAA